MKTTRQHDFRRGIVNDPAWRSDLMDLPKWVYSGSVEVTTNRITWVLWGGDELWMRVTFPL
jgi:hypothetical protein